MKKIIFAVMTAIMMSVTIFASIGVADIDVEIPEDAPDDVEIPDTLPIEPILKIDDTQGFRSGSYDLYIDDLGAREIDEVENTWRITYYVWNLGNDDLYGESDWYDKAWIKTGLFSWSPLADSIVPHDEYDLFEANEDYFFWYDCDFPTGWHWFSQWTDAGENIDEINEGNNNILRYIPF